MGKRLNLCSIRNHARSNDGAAHGQLMPGAHRASGGWSIRCCVTLRPEKPRVVSSVGKLCLSLQQYSPNTLVQMVHNDYEELRFPGLPENESTRIGHQCKIKP